MVHAPTSAWARLALILALSPLLVGGSCSWAFSSNHDDDHDEPEGGAVIVVTEDATFGGFGLAGVLGQVPGVVSAQAGWQGEGRFLSAWLASWTGHERVTRVCFDPARLPFTGLLEQLRAVRATQGARRVAVYAHSIEQESAARVSWPEGRPKLVLRQAGSFVED